MPPLPLVFALGSPDAIGFVEPNMVGRTLGKDDMPILEVPLIAVGLKRYTEMPVYPPTKSNVIDVSNS